MLVSATCYFGHFIIRVVCVVNSFLQNEAAMKKVKCDAPRLMQERNVAKPLSRKALRYIEHISETDSITSLGQTGSLEQLSESRQQEYFEYEEPVMADIAAKELPCKAKYQLH